MAEKTAKKPEAAPQLGPGRLRYDSVESAVWRTIIPAGTAPEALQDPAYWAHNSRKLRFGQTIGALDEEGQWYATFMVMDAGQNWAKVCPLDFYELTPAAPDEGEANPEYEIKWINSTKRYGVIRKSDSAQLKDGLADKAAAAAWLAEHLKGARR